MATEEAVNRIGEVEGVAVDTPKPPLLGDVKVEGEGERVPAALTCALRVPPPTLALEQPLRLPPPLCVLLALSQADSEAAADTVATDAVVTALPLLVARALALAVPPSDALPVPVRTGVSLEVLDGVMPADEEGTGVLLLLAGALAVPPQPPLPVAQLLEVADCDAACVAGAEALALTVALTHPLTVIGALADKVPPRACEGEAEKVGRVVTVGTAVAEPPPPLALTDPEAEGAKVRAPVLLAQAVVQKLCAVVAEVEGDGDAVDSTDAEGGAEDTAVGVGVALFAVGCGEVLPKPLEQALRVPPPAPASLAVPPP